MEDNDVLVSAVVVGELFYGVFEGPIKSWEGEWWAKLRFQKKN